ncbi:response regulator [Hymenobacter fodinae]|uniref:Response regulator n=1 Tax=Hymenobacter fodinae TaxID=2510796 RepID=A0A4Z0P880_9BACT|nr:response regulator [Hymenobacter fodinae]TGE08624.1 response regulator [Hymenobacter fodinae]
MPKLPYIVLVDDDPTANYLHQKLLAKLDVTDQLLVAHNGHEALALLDQLQSIPEHSYPALLLLDIKMPSMDGFSFLEAYKQLPATKQAGILVVMLSTSLQPEEVHRAQQLPIAAFLNKPLTNEKVRQLLQLCYNHPVSQTAK